MIVFIVRRFAFLALLILAGAGCSGSGAVPVKGTVRLDGKELPGATVTFLSQESGGRDASGATDANGVFRLTTFEANDGALRGKYKVIVQPPAPLTTGGKAMTPEEAQRAAAEGAITPKAPTVVIAPRFSQPDQTTLEQIVPPNGAIVFDLQSK